MTVNTLEDISSSDLPSFIFVILRKIGSFLLNNFSIKRKKGDLLTATTKMAYFPPKQLSYPIYFTFRKTGLVKRKK